MDLLKKELLKKRQALQSDFGGKKILKRSEIEQKNLQKIRQQEHHLSKKPSSSQLPNPNPKSDSNSSNPNSNLLSQSSLPPALQSKPKPPETLTDEQRIDVLDLPRLEVIRRLRFLKQPITLFGEDDAARLDRLKQILKSGDLEIDSDITEGQTNDFLRDIYELQKRQKSEGMNNGNKKGKKAGEEDGGSEGEDEDVKIMKARFEDLCDEDKILVFFKRLLNEWGTELEETGEGAKRTAAGKSMVAKYKQCERYLHPLFKFCRKKVLPDDIRQALMVVVNCCMKRDYLAAMDKYIKMAIGNAPWPIGVTMVGIHERSAREKIYTNSVAHIMNDETTRKYLQSVKRLMTFCQRRYPALPSKSVEFNSLANGSDLHSLLSEERMGGSESGRSQEDSMLRLMSASKEH